LGKEKQAERWEQRARQIRKKMNELCWNGKFYTHFVKLTPVTIKGVDENRQLSLSNPMDINRGAADHQKAVSIIKEYIKRRRQTNAFSEWFSIDPPFPDGVFGDAKLKAGAYVNGGIMPLVGGELSRAAFEHGFERYGVGILKRYFDMIYSTGESYLWYFPDGSPSTKEASTSPEASSADAWGSSAMLYAFIEGLCGIEDNSKLFNTVRLSPRWASAGVDKAEVRVIYAASGKSAGYTYTQEKDRISMDVLCPGGEVIFHVLLPEKRKIRAVEEDGHVLDYKETPVEKSRYADFYTNKKKKISVKIFLTREGF
jgi:glycogen debranching enzyme